MTLRRFISFERVLASMAFAAVVGTVTWTWQRQASLRRVQADHVTAELSDAVYAVAPVADLPTAGRPWGKPVSQSSGAEWIYELFTPPMIYYHAGARTFTVTPPSYLAEATNLPFGLELLAVRRERFRLQLVGYVGAPGNYTAAFVSEHLPETLLARAGQRFDQLGLALKSFELRRIAVHPRATQPIYDLAAVATVHDERSSTDVTLDTRGPTLTDTPLAMLRIVTDSRRLPRVLRQGDTFQQDEATFRIEHIQLDPPEVVVAKQTAGLPYPEIRVLKPESANKTAGAAATAKRFHSTSSRTGVARSASRP
jgi:hypothetical protein